MSGVRWTVNSGNVATTTSTRTILQVTAASNHRLLIKSAGIFFEGISNTAKPIHVRILRQTDAGTAVATPTVQKLNPGDDETLQVSAGANYSSEPTPGAVIWEGKVHPQQGYMWQAPFGGEIPVPGGSRLAVDVTAEASVNCTVHMEGEE
jgi:hypothetical protein